MAFVSLGLAIYSAVEQQKAGRASKKEQDEMADEERRRAEAEGSMSVEAQHDLLVEGQRELGALKALGGKGGVGGPSFGTMEDRIKARTRRKMFLLNKRTSEAMTRGYFSAEQFESEGTKALKRGKQESYMTVMQTGSDIYRRNYMGWGSGYR